jgi:hypothetical protein
MKGFFLGALGLIALEKLVTGKVDAQGNTPGGNAVGGFFDVLAKGVRMFVDPKIPAFRWKTAAPAGTPTGGQAIAYRPPVTNPATNPFGLPRTPLGVPSTYA